MKFKIDIWMLSLKTLRTYGNKNDKKTKNWLEKRTFLFQSIPEVKWPKRNIVKQKDKELTKRNIVKQKDKELIGKTHLPVSINTGSKMTEKKHCETINT